MGGIAIGVVAFETTHEALEQQLDHRIATETQALIAAMKEALAAHATGGEVSNALRDVWGMYSPPDAF